VRRGLATALVTATLLGSAGCGHASDGAALVRGTLYQGRAPWETSLDFTGRAVVHGALPFRIEIAREPAPAGATGRDGRPAGLTVEIRDNLMPAPGERLSVGGDEGAQATVRWVPEGEPDPSAVSDGADLRFLDGGFEVHAVSGTLELDMDGRAPGDGVRGRFELVFRTGETVSGTFASTFVD